MSVKNDGPQYLLAFGQYRNIIKENHVAVSLNMPEDLYAMSHMYGMGE